ncbi:hypothetical protein PS6_008620 [Mucor atramentarius]
MSSTNNNYDVVSAYKTSLNDTELSTPVAIFKALTDFVQHSTGNEQRTTILHDKSAN